MLMKLWASLGSNKELITILLIGAFLMMKNTDSILDRFAPKRIEIERGPAATEVTKEYVDVRIQDLDKLSAQRHQEAMITLNNMNASLAQQAVDIRKLSDRVYDLARTTRHVNSSQNDCKTVALASLQGETSCL